MEFIKKLHDTLDTLGTLPALTISESVPTVPTVPHKNLPIHFCGMARLGR